jgi:heparan-alpha-glucosaminide N-acetyltransferase
MTFQQFIYLSVLNWLFVYVGSNNQVPNCPVGYVGPGGLADNGAYIGKSCTGGAAGYIDRQFFGSGHIYSHPRVMKTYLLTGPFDPEGLLGSFTSVIMTYLGVQVISPYTHYLSSFLFMPVYMLSCRLVE